MTSPATPGAVQREPELAGQTVVVIGGSSGIGLETARRARTEGAEVIITGRNPDRLRQAAPAPGASGMASGSPPPPSPRCPRSWRPSRSSSLRSA